MYKQRYLLLNHLYNVEPWDRSYFFWARTSEWRFEIQALNGGSESTHFIINISLANIEQFFPGMECSFLIDTPWNTRCNIWYTVHRIYATIWVRTHNLKHLETVWTTWHKNMNSDTITVPPPASRPQIAPPSFFFGLVAFQGTPDYRFHQRFFRQCFKVTVSHQSASENGSPTVTDWWTFCPYWRTGVSAHLRKLGAIMILQFLLLLFSVVIKFIFTFDF